MIAGKPASMRQYFRRVEASKSGFFTSSLGWSDLRGAVRASSVAAASPLDVSDRLYFRRVLATHEPYVSAGLLSRRTKQPTVVIAVPTFDAHGRLSGVLSGGIQLNTVGQSQQSVALGFQGLTILDRNGQLLLAGLAHPANAKLVRRIQRAGTGDFEGTEGLQGGSHHVVAFATARLPAWTIAIDRSESALYAAPRRSLILAFASLGGAVLLILFILSLLVRRSGRAIEAQGEQVQAWSRLTRTLSDAATPSEVANTLIDSLQAGFPDAVVVVDVESESGDEVRASSRLPGWRRVAGDAPRLRKVAALTTDTPRTRSLEREKPLRELYLAYGRRLKAVHSVPILDQEGASTGSISLMTARGRLEPSEWELLGAVVDQASRALARARVFEHEHDLAVRLQRSLLPDRLPRVAGIELAGEYLAGGTGIEVGGDWYDAVYRPDGILHLCVGDVSGRGVGAATVMGRQRNIFRAHAYDLVSPAEILRRMLRHVNDDEMITAACVSIDPLAGEIAYSCAGHPPPLLFDGESGVVTRLDGASAPPLGVAEASDIIETSIRLPEPARLVMYTDGLVERRSESIERGIEALGEVLAGDARRLVVGRSLGDRGDARRAERRRRAADGGGGPDRLTPPRAAGRAGCPSEPPAAPPRLARTAGLRRGGGRRDRARAQRGLQQRDRAWLPRVRRRPEARPRPRGRHRAHRRLRRGPLARGGAERRARTGNPAHAQLDARRGDRVDEQRHAGDARATAGHAGGRARALGCPCRLIIRLIIGPARPDTFAT